MQQVTQKSNMFSYTLPPGPLLSLLTSFFSPVLSLLLSPPPSTEWEFGGLPAWLLSVNSSMVLRSSDPAFLSAVDDWWGVLLPALAHLTIDKGGPIIMVQVGYTNKCTQGMQASIKQETTHMYALKTCKQGSSKR